MKLTGKTYQMDPSNKFNSVMVSHEFGYPLFIGKGGIALEVGAGKGEDASVFESLGYMVEKFDKKDGMDLLDFDYKENSYDFINVNNVLPFIPEKEKVRNVLYKMAHSLKKGGILNFSLFGDEDEWYGKPHMSFFSFHEASEMVEGLGIKIIDHESSKYRGKTMAGEDKNWHILRFILVKQ